MKKYHFKNIAKHSLIYGLGDVLGKTLGFFMIPVYTRFLTPTDYGIYELLILTSKILTMFFSLGLSSATLRYYFEYDEDDIRKKVISTALIVSVSVSFCGAFIGHVFRNQLSLLCFDTLEYGNFFTYILISMAFELAMEIPLTYIRAKELSHIFLIQSVGGLAIGLSLNIYFVVYLHMGVKGILLSNLLTASFLSCALIIYTIAKTTIFFSRNLLEKLMRYGWPLIFSGFGFFIIQSADRFFLKHYLTLDHIGLYSLADRFVSVFPLLVVGPFWKMYGPYRFSIMKREDAKDVYAAVQKGMFAFCVFIGLTIILLADDLIKIITTPAFFGAYRPIPFLVMAAIARAFYYLVQTGIYLQKETKIVPKIVWGAAIADVLANFILVPALGIVGAAQARFIANLFLAAITYIVSQKVYYIKYAHKANLWIILTGGAAWGLASIVNFDDVWISLAVNMIIVVMAGAILIKFTIGSPRKFINTLRAG